MRDRLRSFRPVALAAALLAGCGNDPAPTQPPAPLPPTSSKIARVVVIVQENHSFDDHFGRYCTAPAGSNPSCTDGPACCEAAPATEPGGAAPVELTDDEHGGYDPDHSTGCTVDKIDDGRMDHYVTGG